MSAEPTTEKPSAKRKASLKKKKWAPLTAPQAREALATSVHFYSKATNSNAAPAGFRLPAREQPLPLKFVTFSSTQLDRKLTTYTVGAPRVGPFNQCMSVLEGLVDEVYESVPPEQKLFALQASSVLDEPFQITTIDPRLRQLLMPEADGTYTALTPLHSDPFSAEIDRRLRVEREAGFARRNIVSVDTGGSKPQNVGRRTRYLGRLLAFDAPRESASARRAFGIFHQGIRFKDLLPVGLIKDFAAQYLALASPAAAELVDWREFERATFRQAAAHVLTAAQSTAREVAAEDAVPGKEVSAPSVDSFARALLDPAKRDAEWRIEFARRLVDAFETFEVDRSGARLAPSGTFGHLIQYVEEEAL